LRFTSGVAALTAVVALLLMLVTVRVRPAGFVIPLGLSLVMLALAVQLWKSGEQRALTLTLIILVVSDLYFIFGWPNRADSMHMRLAQVVVAIMPFALCVSAVLARNTRIRPVAALAVAIGITATVVFAEAVAGVVWDSPVQIAGTRDEWVGLLPPRRRIPRPPADSAASRQPAAAADSNRPAEAPGPQFGAADLSQPLWSAQAERDSELGIRFKPNSALRTLYPDNPRGYFTAADYRPEIWNLVVAGGSAASVHFPSDSLQLVRVEIARAPVDSPSWHILLNQPGLTVERRARYLLEFRARADAPRRALVAVAQADAPFGAIGLQVDTALTRQWKHFYLLFQATSSEQNARIYFSLGASTVAAEIDSVQLTDQSGRPVVPTAAREPYSIQYHFDGAGCRASDARVDSARAPESILVLGDGFAMGVGVNERETMEAKLEAGLNRTGQGSYRVVNCGVPGYGSREERVLYSRVAATYHPRVVLVVLGTDDDRTDWEIAQKSISALRPSRLERLFKVWGQARAMWRSRRTQNFRASAGELIRLDEQIRHDGGRLVAVFAPWNDSNLWSAIRRTVLPVLAARGITVIDASDSLHGADTLSVHPTDPHPNERVHAMLAARLMHDIQSAGAAH
jgi:hypothetical protein